MSAYDPNDGYEPCAQCGQLTSAGHLCAICSGAVVAPKAKIKPSRSNLVAHHDTDYTRRNRRKGYGWKKAHES